MATVSGAQSLTLGSETLTLNSVHDKKYEHMLAKGNTKLWGVTVTDKGKLLERLSHEQRGTIESHVLDFELTGPRAATYDTKQPSRMVKVHVVISCAADEPTEETLLSSLVTGVCDYLPTVLPDIMASRV